MFKNRWGALIFVFATAFGAANLIGEEDDQGVLLSAADELTAAQNDLGIERQEFSQPGNRPVIGGGDAGRLSPEEDFVDEYAPDADLIDDALGVDPEPDIDPTPPGDDAKEQGDVVLYIENT